MNKRILLISIAVFIVLLVTAAGIKNFIVSRSVRSLEMAKSKIDAVYDYALILYSQKEYDKALRAFEIIANQKSDPGKREDALNKLAQIYLFKKDLISARNYYKEIVEYFPDAKEIADIQKKMEDINMKLLFSPVITEESVSYVIKPNDTLGKIAREHNTTVELIKKSNNLSSDIIIPGNMLKVNNANFNIFVDKSQNILFLKRNGEIIKAYTVSTGANNSTPVGKFKIEEKMVSPVWYKMGAIVSSDSAEYELGKRWMGISVKGYGIHGTNDPSSIGKQITKGCVRMQNPDVEELYAIVPSGTEVEIVD